MREKNRHSETELEKETGEILLVLWMTNTNDT